MATFWFRRVMFMKALRSSVRKHSNDSYLSLINPINPSIDVYKFISHYSVFLKPEKTQVVANCLRKVFLLPPAWLKVPLHTYSTHPHQPITPLSDFSTSCSQWGCNLEGAILSENTTKASVLIA